jgi:hypothetical protein
MKSEGGRMRTHLPAFLALAALAAPANTATRNFGVESFDRVRVDGPFRVQLTTGVAPFASASGSAAGLDHVDIDIQGRTLIVRANSSSWGGYPGKEAGPVEISIGTHELTNAWLNGAGTLQIDKVRGFSFDLSVQGSGAVAIGETDVDQLRVSVAGMGSARLAGRAGKMTAVVRGVSTLDAGELVTKDASIGADGPATVKANVTNAAKVAGSGVATISLTGTPACTAKLAGSASVSGCKEAGSGY